MDLSQRSLLTVFPPELQRCMEENQEIQMRFVLAQEDLSISVADILSWEIEAERKHDELQRLSDEWGSPDRELGRVSGEASLRMGVLMPLLARANQGLVSKEELLRRIRSAKSLYSECQRLSSGANWVNQQFLVVDYPKRLNELTLFEQNIDKFINRGPGSFSQSPPKQSGGCYIATAVYGSYDDPSVLVLRRFRDENLQSSALGRAFIRSYYAISPSLSRHFSSIQWLNKVSKSVLDRFVGALSRKQ